MGLWSRAEQLVHEQRTDEMSEPGNWLKKLFSRERRRAKRNYSISLVAHYWDGAAPVSHAVRNVSSTGLFLMTEQHWYPGTVIRMTLQRSDLSATDRHRSLQVMVKVVRACEDGVGCSFVLSDRAPSASTDAPDARTLNKFLNG